MFDLILKLENLSSKTDNVNLANQGDFDNKIKDITSNKNELNELPKKI